MSRLAPNPPRMLTRACLLAALALSAALALAQSTLSGRVVDAESGRPIPYAHVGIAERGIGTTSGHDGRFSLVVPPVSRTAALTVSCIGYDTYRRTFTAVEEGATLSLKPSQTGLTEVLVMDGEAALNIVRRAVAAIPDNYPTTPTNALAFYRESLTDDSLRYRYLAEGVLDVHKTSYRKRDEGQVGLVQGRKVNLQDPLDTAVRSGFTSGHMAAHRFDVVKNREDFLDEDYFDVYRYRLAGMTSYDGRAVYVIAFAPDPDAPTGEDRPRKRNWLKLLTGKFGAATTRIEPRLEGRVYIEKDGYAIVRAEFEVTAAGLRKRFDYPLYSGHWDANAYTVNYREFEGRWYFGDALREGDDHGGGHYVNEVKVTDLLAGSGEPIPYLERIGRSDAFVNMTGRYSEDFWRAYNVVPMREGLAEGMRQFELMRAAQDAFAPAYRDSVSRVRRQRDSLRRVATAESREQRSEPRPGAGDGGSASEADGEWGEGEWGEDDFDGYESGFFATRTAVGFGAHALSSGPLPLAIAYGSTADAPALSREGILREAAYVPLFRYDLDFRFHRNAFARYSGGFDFTSDIYKQHALGMGAEANLQPGGRPINVRAVAQYSFLRYYRTLGNAGTPDRKTNIGGATFKGDAVRLGYGESRHDLAIAAEVAVETRRGREVYVRGTYHYNLAAYQGVWFKETRQVFRKDERLPVDDERVSVRSAGADFAEPLTPRGSWSVTAGWVFGG